MCATATACDRAHTHVRMHACIIPKFSLNSNLLHARTSQVQAPGPVQSAQCTHNQVAADASVAFVLGGGERVGPSGTKGDRQGVFEWDHAATNQGNGTWLCSHGLFL